MDEKAGSDALESWPKMSAAGLRPGLRLRPISPINSVGIVRWEASVMVTLPGKTVVKVAVSQGAVLSGGLPFRMVERLSTWA